MRLRRLGVLAAFLLVLSPAPALGRPGPALLYERAPRVGQLAPSRLFRAAPLLVSGTDAYRRGEYLYQDYLFDDYGADTTPALGASASWGSQPAFAPAAGDVAYPVGDRYRSNAADIVELRLRPTRKTVVYRVTLNTATARDAMVVGIGIDRHRRPGAAPVPWPRGAGVSSPGLDSFITAWGTGGEVQTGLPGGRVRRLPRGAVRMDLARNQMTITVPRSLLNPRHATWRYVAGAGLWGGHGWQRPSSLVPGVFNLAFRFHEPVGSVHGTGSGVPPYTTQPGTGSWFEDGQARELGAGTTGTDHADIDFARLARRVTAPIHRPGSTQARIYPSSLRVREGVNHDGFPEFGGSLQPYLLTIPPGYRRGRAAPLLLSLHPSNSGYQPFHVFMPNWLRELGGVRDPLIVTPLSRGLNGPDPNSGEFTGAAEADLFETWADVRRRFSIDAGDVGLSGYSLGAYDDYHLAERFPDLFKSIFSVVGAPPTNGRDTELLANLRWIPVLAWNQVDDALVPYSDASAAASRLRSLGLRHEQWSFPGGNHLAPALRDDWAPAARWLRHAGWVIRDPSRVDFGFYPSLDAPSSRVVGRPRLLGLTTPARPAHAAIAAAGTRRCQRPKPRFRRR
jgi:hypothetical protein